jgi:serine/threonine protein kinase
LKLGFGRRLGSESGENTLIVNDCTVLSTLGSGSFGEVLLCKRDSGQLVALKALSKSRLERKREVKYVEGLDGEKQVVVVTALDRVYSEIQIMRSIGMHLNIISLIEVFTDASSDDLYLCLDYANAGQLMTFDKDSNCFKSQVTNGPFPLSIARQCFFDLTRALKHLHSKGIAHRDIKPENLLLDSSGILRVCDFSVAKQFSNDSKSSNDCESESYGWVTDTAGSFLYLCPEACSGSGYSAFKADVWAAGCVLYLMIFGVPPFGSASHSTMELFDAVQNDPLTFPFHLSCDPSAVKESVELLDILEGILGKKKETERLTLEEVCERAFVFSFPMEKDGSTSQLSASRFKFEETDLASLKPYSSPTLAVMQNIRNSSSDESRVPHRIPEVDSVPLSSSALTPSTETQATLFRSKEGFLIKRGHIIQSNKRRFFSLQGEKMLYGKVYERVQRGEINLRGATVHVPSSTLAFSITERGGPAKRGFFGGEKTKSFSTGKVYHLQAENESERAHWLECIEVNIKIAGELESDN